MSTPKHNAALERLMFAIRQMVDHGEIVPCLNEARSHLWISDDVDKQLAASIGCGNCPALEACRKYATDHPEPFGVWAGRINGEPVAA